MASPREHFALEWIKSDLLETLNEARIALDDYAEQGEDETRLRACLTSLHQVHGTLLMLELEGVTLLADHLEQTAQAMLAGSVSDTVAASQILMQGILELPGHLEELQRGGGDGTTPFIPLVNEMRVHLGTEPLPNVAGTSLSEGASESTIDLFRRFDGQEKVVRMRSAYQNVLLSILKGEDRRQAVETLAKIAGGLQRLTQGCALERQWQAFGEFIASLAKQTGALEPEAVKLLRRVDLEIRTLASEGEEALRKPANLELMQQLLEAADARDHETEAVESLRAAVDRDANQNTLAISGRQAMATAAIALREELAVVKDQLDLLARSSSVDLEALRQLAAPLKQIGSTLSLLGFESSREIIANQTNAIENVVTLGDADPSNIQSIASALVQIDENLGSVSSERSEVEQITSDAQLQVLREARRGLENVKTAVVDFVTAHWDVRHLSSVNDLFDEICGALEIIPLKRVITSLRDCQAYVTDKLMQGHQPEWQELDLYADAISGVDYYLERLAEDQVGGSEDILQLAERSLVELQQIGAPAAEEPAETVAEDVAQAAVEAAPAIADTAEFELEIETDDAEAEAQAPTSNIEAELIDLGSLEFGGPEAATEAATDIDEETTPEASSETAVEGADELVAEADEDADADLIEFEPQDMSKLASEATTEEDPVEVAAADVSDEADEEQAADAHEAIEFEASTEPAAVEEEDAEIAEGEAEPASRIAMEENPAFDLGGDVFAALDGAVDREPEPAAEAPAAEESAAEESAAEEYTPEEIAAEAAAEEPAEETELEKPDPEIVEIFLEEVEEVLENVDRWMPEWANNLSHEEALTEIRRAFHTLKGSGRIVQAVEVGELAWGIENMLNRVIDGTVEPSADFAKVANEARDLIPILCTAFEAGQQGDLDAISKVIERADLLSSGGVLDSEEEASDVAFEAPLAEEATTQAVEEAEVEAPQAPEESLEVAPTATDADTTEALTEEEELPDDVAEFLESATDELLQELQDESDAEQTAGDAAADELVADGADEVADDEEAVEPLAAEFAESETPSEPSAVDLFLTEADEYLIVVEQELEVVPWTLSEPLKRAFHTLSGSAGIAGATGVLFIVEPANQVVRAYEADGEAGGDELKNFFADAHRHLRSCIAAMLLNEEWEEPLEFVAAADDLIAQRESAGSKAGIAALLDAPETVALLEHEDAVVAVLDHQTDSAGILNVLADFVALSSKLGYEDVTDVAATLMHTLTSATINGRVSSQARTIIERGYETLIDMLNSAAIGNQMQPQPVLIAELESIDFTAGPEPQESAEEAVEAAAATEDSQPENLHDLDIDPDLIEVFFEEAEEITEELEASIVSWSQEEDNRLHMENLLRGLHTLKGGARLCGLTDLGDMAHEFETVVIEVQSDERQVDAELFSDLNKRYDDIVSRLTAVRETVASGGLAQALAGETAAPDVAPTEEAEAAAAQNASDSIDDTEQPEEVAAADDAQPEAANEAETETNITPVFPAPAALARPQPQDQEQASTIADELPKVERAQQEMVRVASGLLEELVNLAGENSILRARIEQGMSDFTSALDEMETTIERLREQLRRLEIETETQILHRHERDDGPSYENFDPLEMDRYSQLQQLSRGLSESASDMLDLKDTLLFKARESETLLLQQARINTELQEGLMRTRMVPFSRLLPRLRRIVRQVSGELEKEVDFHVQNAEGELDRNLLERMVPPLEHMLRNAVDHGIETAEIRRNFGKPASGRIDLRLSREGGDVVIEISDDGAGIDVESVREKALERGLTSQDALISDEEAMQFILAPGFTTAKSVTQISGRGVGMDVVHSEVKQLGGSIQITSRPGQGTRFILRVPFTVSVNRALMVSVTDDLYAIPLNTIEGIVLLSPEQLEELYASDTGTFEYAGVPYRIRYLGQYLGREYRGSQVGQGSIPVVLVRSGDHAVAVHVDTVQGSREIVVKSLGPQFAGVGGISGATILGDGSVVVILDLLALIRAQRHAQRSEVTQVQAGRPRCVLVVDDSVTVRKVTSRLLERQGMDVLVAKDGVEAVALLQERRPDVMLLDIEMPRMDGFEVARQVRHDDRLVSLPIVMISSRTGEKHKQHASELGVNHFLGKPFQENELLATIDDLVTSRP